ncbi:MAG: cytidine deaminase [Verrucomicrobiae bacterium]|nr:cytidine deaminase [Verrucomicrobiae bacterium]
MQQDEKCSELLVRFALNAMENAVAPYSKFKVGAAIITEEGKVFSGANVESASFGLTCCAERVALFKALTEGYKNFKTIAITAAIENGPMPCGACRQLLAEYAWDADVWIFDSRNTENIRKFKVSDLLPEPFRKF